jgi:aspartate/methionine/tyrosine aminotransferase
VFFFFVKACTTTFIQYAGLAAFTNEAREFCRRLVHILKERRDVVRNRHNNNNNNPKTKQNVIEIYSNKEF